MPNTVYAHKFLRSGIYTNRLGAKVGSHKWWACAWPWVKGEIEMVLEWAEESPECRGRAMGDGAVESGGGWGSALKLRWVRTRRGAC